MRKTLALCGAVLCFALAAAAQDNSAAPAAVSSATATATPARSSSFDLYHWQVGINYNYVRFRPSSGSSFQLNGFNTSLTRYLNDWFGLEADAGAAWGHTPSSGPLSPSQTAKFLFYGGGVHLAYRHKDRVEPWVHALVGGAHLYPKTAGNNLSALGYAAGGGLDIKLHPRLSLRVQGDFLGTHFFSTWQKNFQFQTGLVINF